MLGLQLKLTPAQVRALFLLEASKNQPGMPLELIEYSFYLHTINALRRKGLIDEDAVPTDEGRALINIIYQQAKNLVDMYEDKLDLTHYPVALRKETT